MNILIIDDHSLFIEGIKLLLESTFQPKVSITTTQNSNRALSIIDSGFQFDLIITDLEMHGLSGFDFIEALRARQVKTPTVIVSASTQYEHIFKAHEMKVNGYICKDEQAVVIAQKIKDVISGKIIFPEFFWKTYFSRKHSASTESSASSELKGRLKETLEFIAQGLTNKEIALILGISENTVKFHVRELFKTLDVTNRTSCINHAKQLGFLK